MSKTTNTEDTIDLNHDKMPDPIEDQIKVLQKQVGILQQQINAINTSEAEHYAE